jgi:hypothetical protein
MSVGECKSEISCEDPQCRQTRGVRDESDDNDMRLKDFSVNRNMDISSTRFPHKDVHKETLISPAEQSQKSN